MGKMIDFMGQKIRPNDLAGQVGGLLAGQQDGKVSAASLEGALRKIVQEEMKRGKQRLSWNSSRPPEVPDDLKIGYLNKRLPFLGPYGGKGGYYIQNCMLLDSAGNVVKLEQISDLPNTWFNKQGEKLEAPSTRATLAKMLDLHRQQAAEMDPMLCDVCMAYRAGSVDDRMRHLYHEHPADFADRIGLKVRTQVLTDIPETPEAPEPVAHDEGSGEFICDCGKAYRSIKALKMHQRVAKIHKQAG